MEKDNLYCRAEQIISSFSLILDEDKILDDSYGVNKAEIEAKYQEKLKELDSKRNQRISSVNAQNQSVQMNINAALKALSEMETKVPSKYKKKYRTTSVVPKEPNFQILDELAAKINDGTFGGAVKRFTGTGGYSSMMDMVNDFLDSIEAGKKYLSNEQQNSANYLAQEKALADSEYVREKTLADQKKAMLLSQNDQIYAQSGDALQDKLLKAINAPELVQYDSDLTDCLEQLGAFEETWNIYEPSMTYPDKLMLGAITVPFSIPSPVDKMIQEKMPVAFSSKHGFCVPVTLDLSKPVQLLINYDERCKTEVMQGIQSIIMKWIRFMPPYSFSLTYIDPNDRGSNLGQLQKFEEITTWDICKKVYASREDITKRLKELEMFVDATCSRLAGVGSAYAFNQRNEPVIVQHLVVINDFPEKMDRASEEALDVLINNAAKCGISMIFTKKGNLSELPKAVQNTFLRVNATVNGNTFPMDGKMYDFKFDEVSSFCNEFIENVKNVYNEGFKVDNSFKNYFSTSSFANYRESTQSLLIPFAVDSRKRLVELQLGGALTAHALLSGSTGSGKSTTLHMLITSIILNYHPDDVELWLVDYNKVEFAEYINNRPPHMKLLGLERGAEFSFSLLTKINDECQRRMELFKQVGVSDITEYKTKFGVRSLPRIVLIIDEFHQMTQVIQSEPEYVRILENILSEYRKFGLSCVFSDQAIGDGLRGLTEKGKKQIRTRIAMANDLSEIRETLSVDHSFYDDALRNKMNRMDKGDVIFKRGIKDSTGETQIVIDKYRTVYVTREERIESISYANSLLNNAYKKTDVIIADGQERKYCEEKVIEKYEAEHGGPTQANIPIYVGTPANLNPCFSFSLQEKLDSNVMVIGADTEMRASVLLHTINCFARSSDHEITIFADKRDELYKECKNELEALINESIKVIDEPEEMCLYVNGLLEKARNGQQPKTLLVWLGIESIGADFSMFPEKGNEINTVNQKSNTAIDDLINNIDALLADLEEDEAVHHKEICDEIKEVTCDSGYDARDDIAELFMNGSRFGVHSLVTYSSVKMLKQSRFVKLECFEHKIAFAMSRDDWSSYMERIHYIADLDNVSAVYYDGGSIPRRFRPYLYQYKEDLV